MSRYTGSLWKKSRRLGISLTGTGKELDKRPYAPGQHGPTQRKKSLNMVCKCKRSKNFASCTD